MSDDCPHPKTEMCFDGREENCSVENYTTATRARVRLFLMIKRTESVKQVTDHRPMHHYGARPKARTDINQSINQMIGNERYLSK